MNQGEIEMLRLTHEIGGDVVRQVNDKSAVYLSQLADVSKYNPNRHLSEYVGDGMLGAIPGAILARYFDGLKKRNINAQHGYDEDAMSVVVLDELKKRTKTEGLILTPTGTAANLVLISSFVGASVDPSRLRFITCNTEHVLEYEGDMLQKAGVQDNNIIRLSPRTQADGIVDLELLKRTIVSLDGNFIFQMAIPTNEGVVPPLSEFKEMVRCVKERGGTFLIDGARLTNALVHWGIEIDDLSTLGIDGFTLGTSKKGGIAEVVGIYDKKASARVQREAKSFGHVLSKNAPYALVTGVFLNTDYWKSEARSENESARGFAEAIKGLGMEPQYDVCSNMVFLKLPKGVRETLKSKPEFGETYNDYGPDKNITRVIFTGFMSKADVSDMVSALSTALEADRLSWISDRLRDLAGDQRSIRLN